MDNAKIELKDGTYHIDVTSSSSMFRITDCELKVSDGDMEAVMTLSGKGYEKLYMGTSEEALKAEESEYIYYTENADGAYTYTVPLKALDTDIDCAAWSIKKEQWYDRTLVFKSDQIPKDAFVTGFNPLIVIIPVIAVAAAAAIVAVIMLRKRR